MNLYLLSNENDEGLDMDLVVQETSPERAVGQWRDHWIEEEEIIDTHFDGNLEHGIPKVKVDEVLRVFQISTTPDTPGVLGWHHNLSAGACVLLGHVFP